MEIIDFLNFTNVYFLLTKTTLILKIQSTIIKIVKIKIIYKRDKSSVTKKNKKSL